MPPSDPDFALNDDGTVTVRAGETTHTLRRPTIGQLRHFTEKQRALAAAQVHALTRLAAVQSGKPPEQGAKESVAKFNERYAKFRVDNEAERHKIDDEYEALIVGYVVDTLKRLSDHPDDIPAVDDLPSFCVDRTIPVTLLNHWRTVPLAPGSP